MAKKYIEQIYHGLTQGEAVMLAKELLENLRVVDKADIPFENAEDIITQCLEMSDDCRAFRTPDMKLLCIVGVSKANLNSVGRQIWMLGTNDVYAYKREILVGRAKALLNEWLDHYVLLLNCVNAANLASVRWLGWLGATYLPDITKVSGKRFLNFFFLKKGGD